MNDRWSTASYQAARPMRWYDLMTIVILAAGAMLAVVGWLVFDGSRPI